MLASHQVLNATQTDRRTRWHIHISQAETSLGYRKHCVASLKITMMISVGSNRTTRRGLLIVIPVSKESKSHDNDGIAYEIVLGVLPCCSQRRLRAVIEQDRA